MKDEKVQHQTCDHAMSFNAKTQKRRSEQIIGRRFARDARKTLQERFLTTDGTDFTDWEPVLSYPCHPCHPWLNFSLCDFAAHAERFPIICSDVRLCVKIRAPKSNKPAKPGLIHPQSTLNPALILPSGVVNPALIRANPG